MKQVLILLILELNILMADIIPISKNTFYDTGVQNARVITSAFILITLNDYGFGRYYYIDSAKNNNTVIWSSLISGGSHQFSTNSGIFKIYHKKRKWMSTKYPEESGINNMDYSMFFDGGIALHQGNPKGLSHGCIHLKKRDARILFKHTTYGTNVIVTRESYIPFLSHEEINYIFVR